VEDAVGTRNVVDIVDTVVAVVGELSQFPQVVGFAVEVDTRQRLLVDVVVRAEPADLQAWFGKQRLEFTCPLDAMIRVYINLSDDFVDGDAVFSLTGVL